MIPAPVVAERREDGFEFWLNIAGWQTLMVLANLVQIAELETAVDR